jgi:hypothetical protein
VVSRNTKRDKVNESSGEIKRELGFAYFWLGKLDLMHWDCDSSAKKTPENESGMKI